MSSSETSLLPKSPFKSSKRIVTGHDESGQSTTILVDEVITNPFRVGSDTFTARLWTTSNTPANNTDQKSDAAKVTPDRLGLVKNNGSVCSMLEMPPGGKSPMHRTSSIDYLILVAGSLTLILEDGTEETMTVPGSIVVQRGTLHAWENRGSDWAKVVVVLIDASPVEVLVANVGKKELVEEFLAPAAAAPK